MGIVEKYNRFQQKVLQALLLVFMIAILLLFVIYLIDWLWSRIGENEYKICPELTDKWPEGIVGPIGKKYPFGQEGVVGPIGKKYPFGNIWPFGEKFQNDKYWDSNQTNFFQ